MSNKRDLMPKIIARMAAGERVSAIVKDTPISRSMIYKLVSEEPYKSELQAATLRHKTVASVAITSTMEHLVSSALLVLENGDNKEKLQAIKLLMSMQRDVSHDLIYEELQAVKELLGLDE